MGQDRGAVVVRVGVRARGLRKGCAYRHFMSVRLHVRILCARAHKGCAWRRSRRKAGCREEGRRTCRRYGACDRATAGSAATSRGIVAERVLIRRGHPMQHPAVLSFIAWEQHIGKAWRSCKVAHLTGGGA